MNTRPTTKHYFSAAVIVIALAAASSPANAENGWSVGLSGGIAHSPASKIGPGVKVDAGYLYDNGLRPDFEFSYLSTKYVDIWDSNDEDTTQLMNATMNLWYQPDVGLGRFRPYIGGGGGMIAPHMSSNYGATYHANPTLGVQLGTGFMADITPNLAMTLDYRRVMTFGQTIKSEYNNGSVNMTGTYTDAKFFSNYLGLGIRYTFDSLSSHSPSVESR